MSDDDTTAEDADYTEDNNGPPLTGGPYTALGSLGKRMRARRLMEFLTLRDLAELIGVSRSYLARLEAAPRDSDRTISAPIRGKIEAWLAGAPGPATKVACPHCGGGLEIALTAR